MSAQARVRALRIQQLEEERRAKMVAIRQEQAAIREEVSRLTKMLTGGGGVPHWQSTSAPAGAPTGTIRTGSQTSGAAPLRSAGAAGSH